MTRSAYLDLPRRSLAQAIADLSIPSDRDGPTGFSALDTAFHICRGLGNPRLFLEVTAILRHSL